MAPSFELPVRPLERSGVPAPLLGDRALFPRLGYSAFLGHAAISPLSVAASEAVQACISDAARGGAAAYPVWDAQRQRLRQSLAELLGAGPGEIALTPGTTRGVTDIALGLPWRTGDVLVTFEGEFPANVTPWQCAAAAFGATVRFLPAPEPTAPDADARILENLERELVRGVRFVAVSAVQFQTGFRMPLLEIGRLCRAHGARFLVDGIQACGVVPLNVRELGIDALAAGAHKWLLGLEGSGFLYVRPEFGAELRPLTAGWVSHEEAESFLFQGAGRLRYDRPFKASAAVFEGSSQNAVGFAALEAGVDVCRALGPRAIFEHVQRYHDVMEEVWVARGFRSLRAPGPEGRSCLLCFEVPAHVSLSPLVMGLRARGIMVSTPDGNVRVAPHFSNDAAEILEVALALDACLADSGA